MPILPDYTVVGFYSDNNQPWTAEVSAESPTRAMRQSIKKMLDINGWDESYADDVVVVAVLSGKAPKAKELSDILTGSSLM